jgi:Nucleotidyl transferase AbiEii toxin, Type IV TA system
MPDGGTNRVEIAVCSIPALLAMKGHALRGRLKQKDAYDIYYCIRNHPDGIEALAAACRKLLGEESAAEGYRYIAEKFETPESFGPTCVRQFVQDTHILGARSSEQWQQDAFGQVDAWLRALGLRG